MARLKRTKSELKRQRELLKRFQRYLPTLQLKKQQLQAEVRRVELEREAVEHQLSHLNREVRDWVALFAEQLPLASWIKVKNLSFGHQHIAGVDVPTLERLELIEDVPQRANKPVWSDDGLRVLRERVELNVKIRVLRIQEERISQELRTTNQRVNLFEKIKIPECRENIRIIRIALGDEEVAAVARAKMAKSQSPNEADESEDAA